MGQLSAIEDSLIHLGYKIIAISPDRPSKLTETVEANGLAYTLLSDSAMVGARKLGIAIKFSPVKVLAYKLNNQDIEAASGRDHHLIPVPTVLLINTNGKILYVHSDTNHRKRIAPEEILRIATTHARVAETSPPSE